MSLARTFGIVALAFCVGVLLMPLAPFALAYIAWFDWKDGDDED